MWEGVPQAGVISPTLFLLYINNIMTVLPRHVSNTLHAVSLTMWSASEYTTSSAYRIQEAVNKVQQWSSDQRNEDTGHSFFPFPLQRKIHHKAWRHDTTPSTDSQLSQGKAWHSTLIEATYRGHGEKGIKKLAVLKKLSGTHWGVNSKILKTIYMGAV